MSCLLALTIFATLPSHPPIPIQAEPKEEILVLAKSEDEIDLSELSTETTTRDSLAKIGLVCHEFVVNDHHIFISERVAPINSYQSASKLTAELQKSASSTFEYGSEAGKYFREVFESVSLKKNFEAKPTDNCFALALQVSFNTDQNALKVPVSTPVGLKMQDVARPIAEQFSREEVAEASKNLKRSFAQHFGHFTKFDFVIKSLNQKRMSQEEAVESSIAVSIAMSESSKLVNKLFREYAQNHASLLNRLISQYASEIASIPKEGAKFDDLPQATQNTIGESIRNFHEAYGFASREEAESFLNTNPTFKVNFTISLFEGHSVMNPQTGEPNRQGIFVNLGNPNNPNKPN